MTVGIKRAGEEAPSLYDWLHHPSSITAAHEASHGICSDLCRSAALLLTRRVCAPVQGVQLLDRRSGRRGPQDHPPVPRVRSLFICWGVSIEAGRSAPKDVLLPCLSAISIPALYLCSASALQVPGQAAQGMRQGWQPPARLTSCSCGCTGAAAAAAPPSLGRVPEQATPGEQWAGPAAHGVRILQRVSIQHSTGCPHCCSQDLSSQKATIAACATQEHTGQQPRICWGCVQT